MGSITFQVVGDASVGTRTRTFTVPDAHVNRLVEWAKWKFTPEGQPDLSTPQALLAWSERMMSDTKKHVLNFERNEDVEELPQPPPFETT
jgi:hypothetical protein